MKKFLLFSLSLLAGLGVFWFITGSVGWQAISKPLFLLHHWQALIIFLLTLLIAVSNVWRWQFILKSQGYKFSLRELTDILIAGFAISYVTPIALFGGEFFMALTLKKRFSVPWEKNIASIAVLRILNLTITLLLLVLGLLAFLILAGLPPERIALISLSIVFGLGAVLIFFYYRSFKKRSILAGFLTAFEKKISLNGKAVIETEKEVFSFFKPNQKKMWQGLGLAFLGNFFNITRFWFIIFFLKGVAVSVFSILAVFAFVDMAYVFPFPATLGSLEASQAYVFGSLGLGSGVGTAFSLVLRGAELSLALIGFFFIIRLWFKTRALAWLLEKFAITKKN